jgi:hypothetical protein
MTGHRARALGCRRSDRWASCQCHKVVTGRLFGARREGTGRVRGPGLDPQTQLPPGPGTVVTMRVTPRGRAPVPSLPPQGPSRRDWLSARVERRGDDGFSLIELVIVLVTLPIVVGAIATVVITVLNNTTAATQSIFDSADSQITSVNFVRDVQSAAKVTTSPNPTAPVLCTPSPSHQFPSPHLLLALQVATSSDRSGNLGVVSYWWVSTSVKVLGTPTIEAELVRQVCPNGSNPGGSTVVAHDISSTATPPTVAITPAAQSDSAGGNWTSTTGITGISLTALEPASSINYQVVAVPRAWSSGTGGSGP